MFSRRSGAVSWSMPIMRSIASPGIDRMSTNEMTETPNSTGMSSTSRRRMKVSMAPHEESSAECRVPRTHRWSLGTRHSALGSLLIEPDVAEFDVAAGGDVGVALDVGLHRFVLVGDEEADPGEVLEENGLDLLVDLGPSGLVGLLDALVDQCIDLGVGVVDEVGAGVGAEVGDDAVRIDVAAGAGHTNVEGAIGVDIGDHRRVLNEVQLSLDVDLLELLLEHDGGIGQKRVGRPRGDCRAEAILEPGL